MASSLAFGNEKAVLLGTEACLNHLTDCAFGALGVPCEAGRPFANFGFANFGFANDLATAAAGAAGSSPPPLWCSA